MIRVQCRAQARIIPHHVSRRGAGRQLEARVRRNPTPVGCPTPQLAMRENTVDRLNTGNTPMPKPGNMGMPQPPKPQPPNCRGRVGAGRGQLDKAEGAPGGRCMAACRQQPHYKQPVPMPRERITATGEPPRGQQWQYQPTTGGEVTMTLFWTRVVDWAGLHQHDGSIRRLSAPARLLAVHVCTQFRHLCKHVRQAIKASKAVRQWAGRITVLEQCTPASGWPAACHTTPAGRVPLQATRTTRTLTLGPHAGR